MGRLSVLSELLDRPALSSFWSGLIPSIQPGELEFFPARVKQDLTQAGFLDGAGEVMNESRSMGTTARAIGDALRNSPLGQDFVIEETPRVCTSHI